MSRVVERAVVVAFCAYLVALGFVTLRGTGVPIGFEPEPNLTPGRTLVDALDEGRGKLLVGNLVLLVPLGVFLAVRGVRWRVAVAFAIATPISIEGLQWVLDTGRSADVDDVIVNVSGCLAAFAVVSSPPVRRWFVARPDAERRRSEDLSPR